MTKITPKITILGGGNICQSIVAGMTHNNFAPNTIMVVDRHQNKLLAITDKYKVNTSLKAACQIQTADVLILAVKPQSAHALVLEIAPILAERSNPPLIISVMAGLNTAVLSKWLGQDIPIVRAMPNTPSAVGLGACGLSANSLITDSHKKMTEAIISTFGIVEWVDESHMDIVTAVSGSGPAFICAMVEAVVAEAVEAGLNSNVALRLFNQTLLGTAKLLESSGKSPAELRESVTSKHGTTASGLEAWQSQHVTEGIRASIRAAKVRSKELGIILSKTEDLS